MACSFCFPRNSSVDAATFLPSFGFVLTISYLLVLKHPARRESHDFLYFACSQIHFTPSFATNALLLSPLSLSLSLSLSTVFVCSLALPLVHFARFASCSFYNCTSTHYQRHRPCHYRCIASSCGACGMRRHLLITYYSHADYNFYAALLHLLLLSLSWSCLLQCSTNTNTLTRNQGVRHAYAHSSKYIHRIVLYMYMQVYKLCKYVKLPNFYLYSILP